ncbi:MAG: glycosyltransferase, partial [Nitrospinales bacterium]
ILIVDNGSTDGTLTQNFPEKVTVIRNEKNLGTSGAVVAGFKYAISRNYDWIWVFDADTAPEKDALEKLVQFYQDLSSEEKSKTRLIASLPIDAQTHQPYHGIIFDLNGSHHFHPSPQMEFYKFDGAMWTGCLYNLNAVQQVGLPSLDYVLDWGEYEYGYRGKVSGLNAFMVLKSVVHHNIGGQPSLVFRTYRLGPLSIKLYDFPAIRCYYLVRNMFFFWFYEYRPRRWKILFPKLFKMACFTINFLLRPISRKAEWTACIRGLWDGYTKNIQKRY